MRDETNRIEVAVGSTVAIHRLGAGDEVWTISAGGGYDEDRHQIGEDAPLARALMGAGINEIRCYRIADRTWTVMVTDVQFKRHRRQSERSAQHRVSETEKA